MLLRQTNFALRSHYAEQDENTSLSGEVDLKLFSCFVYKQPVTPVFQTVATNTQPHLFRMR